MKKVDRKDIEVSIESNNWIRLSFEKKQLGLNDDDTGGSTFIIQERKIGSIERVLHVPICADMQSGQIQYKDGVLYIQFKKKKLTAEMETGRKLLVE